MNLITILNALKTAYSFCKKYAKYILLAYLVLATVAVVWLFRVKASQSKEIDRLSTNQTALMSDVELYKTESGKSAARVTELELSKGEFEKLCEEQKDVIDDLNLKVRRLQSMTTTSTETEVNAKTSLRDTIVYYVHDTTTVAEKARAFEWADEWNKIDGIVYADSVDVSYHGKDTINIVATRVPKQWWFFKWGTKYIQIDAVNSNPSSTITYSKSVRIKK